MSVTPAGDQPGVGAGAGRPAGAAGARAYLDPYRRMVATAGPCFEALLWRSVESQRARFGAIAGTVDLGGRCVADMGCGRADLALWLRERGVEMRRYVGVEALGELLECSRRRAAAAGLANAEFVQGDFAVDEGMFERLVAGGVDTVVFSGSLNTFAQHEAMRVLGRAWRAVRRTPGGVLVFNFLSDGARPRKGARGRAESAGPAHQFETRRMLAWALRRTRRVVFRQDYLGGQDAMIAMRGK